MSVPESQHGRVILHAELLPMYPWSFLSHVEKVAE